MISALSQQRAGPRVCRQRRAASTVCQAVAEPSSHQSRRQTLLFGAALAVVAANPAAAITVQQSVCSDKDTDEEATACRATSLAQDASSQQSYSTAATRTTGKGAYGVPVAVLDDAYGKATVELAETLNTYFTMDVYDKKRAPLIKQLKENSNAWVSKYARGGSVRKLSARKMYIAVDAVQGHLASSGLAPFPAAKRKTVDATIGEALAFLAEGK